MSRNKLGLGILAFLALICAAVILIINDRTPSEHRHEAPVEYEDGPVIEPSTARRAASPHSPVAGREPDVHESRNEDAAPTSTVLRITDAHGSSVMGARVLAIGDVEDRNLNPDSTVARSDAHGHATLVVREKRVFAVWARGFVTASVELDKGQAEQTVVLKAGSVLEVRCVDLEGKPVKGASVLVSGSSISELWTRRKDLGIPGPVASAAIHRDLTDDDGRVVITGLPTGSCRLLVDHEFYFPTNSSDWSRVLVPDAPVEVVMAEFYAFAARFVGDRLLADGVLYGTTALRGFNGAIVKTQRIQSELRRRSDIDVAIVGVPKNGDDLDLKLAAFLERTGAREYPVKLVPLSRLEVAVFENRPSNGAAPACGYVKVRLTGIHGESYDISRFATLWPRRTSLGMTDVDAGETYGVIPGDYVIKGKEFYAGLFEPKEFTVVRGETKEIEVSARWPLVACTIHFFSSTPGTIVGLRVFMRSKGRGLGALRISGDTREVWLPDGPVEVAVDGPGFVPTVYSLNVTRGGESTFEVPLERIKR